MSSNNLNRSVLTYFKKYCIDRDCHYIDSLIISIYITQRKLRVKNNLLLLGHILDGDNADLIEFCSFLRTHEIDLTLENLVEFFEFVISPKDKQVNGAVYTPSYIREYIVDNVLELIPRQEWRNKTFGDIACGCGGFFLTLASKLASAGLSFEEIYKNNIFGVDIQQYSVDRCSLLLSLLAVENGEDIPVFDFNIYTGNSLNYDWSINQKIKGNGGFDFIIGNPPYVGASKIDDESKRLLVNWSVSQSGKADLYIPFFQIALENLVPGGLVGYITVNNFYRSLNGRKFRSYMSYYHYGLKMVDFGSEQIFKGRSTYTAICFISKTIDDILYTQTSSKDLDKLSKDHFVRIYYENLSDDSGWMLRDSSIVKNIEKIERIGIPLGRCFNIRNGFATLKNDIFILNVIDEDNDFYYVSTTDNKTLKVEKNICRDAIKPNTLKKESEIENKKEKLLFPYICKGQNVSLIPEQILKTAYPYAYTYLLWHKNILAKRDKGKKVYDAWFAFGRTQALNVHGYKLLFPYIANAPHFVIAEQKDLLFYNGYTLVSDDLESLKVVQKILKSKVFWYYIKHTSKPYGSEYFALAKNYIKNFGIAKLTDSQKKKLLMMEDAKDVNRMLLELYDLNLDDI